MQDAHLLGLPEVAGVNGQQQVGSGVLALGLDALHQRGFLVGDELDLHAGLFGVGVEHGLDQLVDTRGVDHDFVGRLHGGAADQGECQGSQEALGCQHGCGLSFANGGQMIRTHIW